MFLWSQGPGNILFLKGTSPSLPQPSYLASPQRPGPPASGAQGPWNILFRGPPPQPSDLIAQPRVLQGLVGLVALTTQGSRPLEYFIQGLEGFNAAMGGSEAGV